MQFMKYRNTIKQCSASFPSTSEGGGHETAECISKQN